MKPPQTTDAEKIALIERLRERAEQDRQCAENNRVTAELLQPQLDLFTAREGKWNTYAVRMAIDHRHSMKRDQQWADDLEAAIALLATEPTA